MYAELRWNCCYLQKMFKMNAVVVVMAMRAAVAAGMGQGKTKLRKIGVWLKGWFSLCSLLGVTWLFGVGFMEYYSTFEYIFVFLNGCQGVFIFLFRCLLNTQVRRSVLNEARQRASVKRFSTVMTQRSSWYITSHSAATRQPSANTVQEVTATSTDTAVDPPPRYSEAVWMSTQSREHSQTWPSAKPGKLNFKDI